MIQEETNIGKVLTINKALEDFLLVKELSNLTPRSLSWHEGNWWRPGGLPVAEAACLSVSNVVGNGAC